MSMWWAAAALAGSKLLGAGAQIEVSKARNGHSNLSEVKQLATKVRTHGMKVWLTVHYSDTWADPVTINETCSLEKFKFF